MERKSGKGDRDYFRCIVDPVAYGVNMRNADTKALLRVDGEKKQNKQTKKKKQSRKAGSRYRKKINTHLQKFQNPQETHYKTTPPVTMKHRIPNKKRRIRNKKPRIHLENPSNLRIFSTTTKKKPPITTKTPVKKPQFFQPNPPESAIQNPPALPISQNSHPKRACVFFFFFLLAREMIWDIYIYVKISK
jgi:hypothetical protein